ncbi:MAG: mitochondrial fission ELM1 family protein [Sphingomonas sp.]|nr:mitochondrial fission ELM1 family protein [Sphingomonas sp.]
MSAGGKRTWVLLGDRTGDNNQLLRLAGELGQPFRAVQLSYNRRHLIPPRLLAASLTSLDTQSRAKIRPPWPDLILGVGYRSVPVALAIRELSGGKAKLVRLGNPRLDAARFDLVITTPQYDIDDAPNLVRLPVGISTAPALEPTREEAEWLAKLPRPHRLLLIGGDTFMWTLSPDKIGSAASTLSQKGGSVIAVSSARSSRRVLDRVAESLKGCEHGLVWGRSPRYPVLLGDAEEIYVTADSVAMISDAVASGKPVGLVSPDKTALGRFFYSASRHGLPVPVRDVRRFWTSVQAKGLAGIVEQPVSGRLQIDPLATAVSAVRALI